MIYPGVNEVCGWWWPAGAGKVKREAVRLQAGEWFGNDVPVAEIPRLRISTNAMYVWRRRWRAGGSAVLVSKGPGGSACRLDEQRQARLAEALEQGSGSEVCTAGGTGPGRCSRDLVCAVLNRPLGVQSDSRSTRISPTIRAARTRNSAGHPFQCTLIEAVHYAAVLFSQFR